MRRFFSGRKTAIANVRLSLIDSRKDMDVENPQKTGMNCRRTGTTLVRRPFGYFWGGPKVSRRRKPWANRNINSIIHFYTALLTQPIFFHFQNSPFPIHHRSLTIPTPTFHLQSSIFLLQSPALHLSGPNFHFPDPTFLLQSPNFHLDGPIFSTSEVQASTSVDQHSTFSDQHCSAKVQLSSPITRLRAFPVQCSTSRNQASTTQARPCTFPDQFSTSKAQICTLKIR